MGAPCERESALQEALRSVERAIGGINTIHIGPLDYNIATTVDCLLVAVRILQTIGQDNLDAR